MKTRLHRHLRSSLAPSSPADADGAEAPPAAAYDRDNGDAETTAVVSGSNGSETAEQGPAVELEGLEPAAGEEQSWSERFSSPEELWIAYRNEQKVRGDLANKLGTARAVIKELDVRLARFEEITREQIEIGKRYAALEAGGRRIPAAGLAALLAGAGDRFEGSAGLREEIPSPLAESASTPAPESPEAAL